MKTQWLNTTGGPIICAGAETARKWLGISGSSIQQTQNDYTRACSIVDYLDIIQCDNKSVAVLGDEPLQSKFFKIKNQLLIARWVSCQSHELAEKVLSSVPDQLPEMEKSKFIELNEPTLFMFDSSLNMNFESAFLQASLDAGYYSITVEKFSVRASFEFLIHRFIAQ
jgi:Immunity protein 21